VKTLDPFILPGTIAACCNARTINEMGVKYNKMGEGYSKSNRHGSTDQKKIRRKG
jgi:hypothetical protein